MKSPFRIPIAVIAVLALILGLEIPHVFASSRTRTTVATDREALVALYQATDGANWTNNHNWLNGEPLGIWYGVLADENGRVVGLALFDNILKGTIPIELGILSFLELLILAHNRLQGPIPPVLGSLADLELLSLAPNQLSGDIPPELGNYGWPQSLDHEMGRT